MEKLDSNLFRIPKPVDYRVSFDGQLAIEARAPQSYVAAMEIYPELEIDVHAIVILYTNGETSGTFQIEEKEIEPGQPTEPDMPTEPEETRPAETEPESSSPATGDDSNIMLYGSMFAMSFAAIVVLLLTFRKRKQNCT